MASEKAAPCRHAGAAPDHIVDQVAAVIRELANDADYLGKRGLSIDEYAGALPAAIERMRGSTAASTGNRRNFLGRIFEAMVACGLISKLENPRYGDDTVYRLSIAEFGDVAVIQKGCPDGAHSSLRWSVPEWARESYLWWLCPSLTHDPGAHVVKGVNRLKQRFIANLPGGSGERMVDGVIFHNDLCGTPSRPCPKMGRGIVLDEVSVPPPCIYVLPNPVSDGIESNWSGERRLEFPKILLALFAIEAEEVLSYTGYVGFQRREGAIRINVSSRYGSGKSTTFRS